MNAQANSVAGALPPGTRLLEYRIERVLGTGGFGITYAAYDPHLRKTVAIKEYLPAELCVRHDQIAVGLRSEQQRAAFNWGREQFIKEARLVALFNHPNLIPVSRFFEANGTAYFVMEYAEGTTLEEILKRQGTLPEASIKSILTPILDGLREVHRARVLHRDIKPSNIILRTDGTPVLIDFGSARQNVGSMTRSIMSVVTAGYAPIEQYAVDGHQGPWTDIYAAGAVAYRALSGRRPLDSVSRIRRDPLTPAVVAGRGKYSPHFLRAVDWALSVNPEDRPVGIADWRQAIEGAIYPPQRSARSAQAASAPWATLEPPVEDEAQPDSEPQPELTLRLAGLQLADIAPEATPRTEVVALASVDPQAAPPPRSLPPRSLPVTPVAAAPAMRPPPVAAIADDRTVPTGVFHEEQRARSPRWAWASLGTTAVLALLALWVLDAGRFAPRAEQAAAAVDAPRQVVRRPAPRVAAAAPAMPDLKQLAQLAPLSVFRDCEGCPVMVLLPSGSFVMGSPAGPGVPPEERPEHRVTLSHSFAIGQHEVTVAQWQSCSAGGACPANPSVTEFRDPRLPVVNVSHADAQSYAGWMSTLTGRRYRLPTEMEWEYAARAGGSTPHFWSGAGRCLYANAAESQGGDCVDEYARRAPVGSFLANPFGLFDMAGNAREWTQDCWRENYSDPLPGTASAPCVLRVVRGGSWRSALPELRSAARAARDAAQHSDDLGFRLAAD